MNAQEKKNLAKEIEKDIERGVYEQFPVVEKRMRHIADKLVKSVYVTNDTAQLSESELRTLRENDYI